MIVQSIIHREVKTQVFTGYTPPQKVKNQQEYDEHLKNHPIIPRGTWVIFSTSGREQIHSLFMLSLVIDTKVLYDGLTFNYEGRPQNIHAITYNERRLSVSRWEPSCRYRALTEEELTKWVYSNADVQDFAKQYLRSAEQVADT